MSLTAVEILAPEVALIQDAKLREFAELCLAELPEHFEYMPASSYMRLFSKSKTLYG